MERPDSRSTPWAYKYDGNGTRLSTTINVLAPTTSTVPSLIPRLHLFTLATRYSIPGPDGQLATESSTTNVGLPAYDYVWMGGKPTAQIDATGTHYDFTDHLDAPTIQTNAAGAVTYQADYEPYGSVYDLRGTANPHQPLRLPGQTAEQFDTGANGATDLSYNNARWYRPEWGQYSQPDPKKSLRAIMPFSYAERSPTALIDPTGRGGEEDLEADAAEETALRRDRALAPSGPLSIEDWADQDRVTASSYTRRELISRTKPGQPIFKNDLRKSKNIANIR